MTQETAIELQKTPAALATSPDAVLQSTDLAMLRQKAQLFVESGLLPEQINTWQKAAVIMLYGRTLNVDEWVAIKHINVVNGSPQIDGQLTLALIERSGLLEDFTIVRSDERVCTLRMKRRGRQALEVTCTLEEATTLELAGKSNWRKQPKTMLFHFTSKQIGRRLFYDVLNAMAGNRDGALSMPDEDAYDADYAEVSGTPDVPFGVLPPVPSTTSAAGGDSVEPIPFTAAEWVLVPEDSSPIATSASEAALPPVEGVYIDADGAIVLAQADGPLVVEEAPFEAIRLGSLNMDSLLSRAAKAGIVKGPNHFYNLVRKLKLANLLREGMTADQVLDAMRKHEAEKELASEAVRFE